MCFSIASVPVEKMFSSTDILVNFNRNAVNIVLLPFINDKLNALNVSQQLLVTSSGDINA